MTAVQQSVYFNAEASLNLWLTNSLAAYTLPSWMASLPPILMDAPSVSANLPCFAINHIPITVQKRYQGGAVGDGFIGGRATSIVEVSCYVTRQNPNWPALLRSMVDMVVTTAAATRAVVIQDYASSPTNPQPTAYKIDIGDIHPALPGPDVNPDVERVRVLIDIAFAYRTAEQFSLSTGAIVTNGPYQPLDVDLTAIAALNDTGFARQAGTGSWSIVPETGTGSAVRAGLPTLLTNDAATTTATTTAILDHTSSGTPAQGFGTGIEFRGSSASVPGRSMGRVRGEWNVATDATRVGDIVVSCWKQGSEVDVLLFTPTVFNINNPNTAQFNMSVKGNSTFDGGNAAVTAVQIYGRAGQSVDVLEVGATSGTPNGYLVVDANGNLGILNTGTLTSPLDLNGNRLRIRTAKTPASAGDTGNQGEICWDSGFVYVCVATNSWKRSAIAAW